MRKPGPPHLPTSTFAFRFSTWGFFVLLPCLYLHIPLSSQRSKFLLYPGKDIQVTLQVFPLDPLSLWNVLCPLLFRTIALSFEDLKHSVGDLGIGVEVLRDRFKSYLCHLMWPWKVNFLFSKMGMIVITIVSSSSAYKVLRTVCDINNKCEPLFYMVMIFYFSILISHGHPRILSLQLDGY